MPAYNSSTTCIRNQRESCHAGQKIACQVPEGPSISEANAKKTEPREPKDSHRALRRLYLKTIPQEADAKETIPQDYTSTGTNNAFRVGAKTSFRVPPLLCPAHSSVSLPITSTFWTL